MWVGLIQSIKGLKSTMEVSQRRKNFCFHQFSSAQSFSRVQLFSTPWLAARQASLSITNSWSPFKLMSIKLVILSSHLILCRPLLLLPPVTPSIRVFSKESTLRVRWPKYWSFSFSISPSNEHPGLVGSPWSPRDSQESSPTPQFKSINSLTYTFLHSPAHIHTWPLEKPEPSLDGPLLAK